MRHRRRIDRLLVNSFELLVDHFAGESVDRHMKPVTLLTFYDEFYEARCCGGVTAQLRDDINHEVPCPRLRYRT